MHKQHPKHDIWRHRFHIEPPHGLLNDPNGLIYHNGMYHVFYQWHPDAPVHGLKYWNHVTSSDLVSWRPHHDIIKPDTPWDSHGAYSGSAFVIDNTIHLFYTGNTRDTNNLRHPFQIEAHYDASGIHSKTPIISEIPQGYTDHFRDPKVFQTDKGLAMILGAQRNDLSGCALIYESFDSKTWHFSGELQTPYKDFGYMWECPDLFSLESQDVFLFCPQGAMNHPTLQTNVYPSAYLLGHYTHVTLTFDTQDTPQLLDHGFDFYAPQTFLDEHQQRVLIAWLGSAEGDIPTDIYNWAHVLSLPRVLSIENQRLIQRPHPNLKSLRKESVDLDAFTETYELIVSNISGTIDIDLYTNQEEKLKLSYDPASQCITLDRSTFQWNASLERGTTRTLHCPEGLSSLHVFRDSSTIEIFINNGMYTMSARFFPMILAGNVTINTMNPEAKWVRYTLEDTHYDI